MRKVIKFISLLLIVVMFTGCASHINKVMNSWMYHHYSDLMASWGPPQYLYDDGKGGRILVYTSPRAFAVPGSSYTTFNANVYDNYIWGSAVTTYNPSRVYTWTAYRMFWINKQGTIYRWSWKGL